MFDTHQNSPYSGGALGKLSVCEWREYAMLMWLLYSIPFILQKLIHDHQMDSIVHCSSSTRDSRALFYFISIASEDKILCFHLRSLKNSETVTVSLVCTVFFHSNPSSEHVQGCMQGGFGRTPSQGRIQGGPWTPPRSSKIGYKCPKGGRPHLLTSSTIALGAWVTLCACTQNTLRHALGLPFGGTCEWTAHLNAVFVSW